MDRLDAMRAFVTVAKEGSFTKAANKLALSTQLVSKYVSQLEDHLNIRLLNRTTRKIHLTEAGIQCLEHSRQILESVDDMEGHFGQLQAQAQGHLHISAPASFATLHLAPLICEFKKQHPAVKINLQLNDRKIDVVEEGFDLALRIGHLKSSSMVARKIAPVRLVLCAAPDYLARNGTPVKPSDLHDQHYLRYSYMDRHPQGSELLSQLSQYESSFTANNGEVLMDAAIAGEGYVLQPTFIVYRAIQRGQLQIILPECEPEPLGLYATYPHRKLMATKMTVFLDFLRDYFGQPPYWDKATSQPSP